MGLLTTEQRSRVQHVACDFLESGNTIAQALKGANVHATHIFFYSYLQPKPPPGAPIWSNADELVKVNSALLSNFLEALPLAGIKPSRFLLQTGAKNYGNCESAKTVFLANIARRRAPRSRTNSVVRIRPATQTSGTKLLLSTRRPPLQVLQRQQCELERGDACVDHRSDQ